MAKYNNRRISLFSLLLLVFLYTKIVFCEQKNVKKIFSDLTEFNREKNIVKFISNVKAEFENGYILCDKAEYSKTNKTIFCESNVYFVGISTAEDYVIEINSQLAEYNLENKILEFKKNVHAKYKSLKQQKEISNEMKIKSDFLELIPAKQMILCRDNVEIFTKEDKIFCSSAKYLYEDEILFINEEEKIDKVQFISSRSKMKSCLANKAIINLKEDTIYLKGETEVIFIQ